ncbi:hypothetical protein [Paraburkholderia saeva]|uniref:hypothetical protein n=1 Tax=Paraburkholderia saeva TaxID=2777537 RepID=UPI001D9D1423|nr:hypothetical protein [Paraburkholderia saeva]CAG4885628.1 hypothetical protein R70241_00025 [Paraburkholderia saeva]
MSTLTGHSTQRVPDGKFRGYIGRSFGHNGRWTLGQFRSNCVVLPDRSEPDPSLRQGLQELARQIAQRVAAYRVGVFRHQLELEKFALGGALCQAASEMGNPADGLDKTRGDVCIGNGLGIPTVLCDQFFR